MRNRTNIILKSDSYKISHWKQYPKGTTRVYSFFESRGGRYTEIVLFGLQYIIKAHLEGVVVTAEDIDEAREYFAEHFGNDQLFNEAGWRRIVEVHGGRLPVHIKAVAEGTKVSQRNVMLTIVNTDPELPWLTNYLETLICQVWYPTTVATHSYAMRQLILNSLEKTGDPSLIDFKLHDFGYRGSTSDESAGIGGAAHLVNFKGTDTVAALLVARRYYGERMAGFSLPAAEHSTITSWGRNRESAAYANMLESFPTGLVAVVSDSYDIYNACKNIWGVELKDKILERDGVLVVRPDSGYPPEVVVKVLELLGEAFGFTVNAKGYKVIHPKVRVIQGDGIDYDMLVKILEATEAAGWSTDNLAFGSGGGLLQNVNRDTCKFAFKCSAIEINGEWHDVYKDPVTDPGKRSKAGRMMLVRRENGEFATLPYGSEGKDLLIDVFLNGELLIDHSFADIRNRALNM